MSANHANLTSVVDYDYYDEDMTESANAYQTHRDPVDPGSDDGEEWMRLLLFADTWDDDLDPEVSAQLVQASAEAYLSFGKETVKGKGKAKGQGQISCSPVTSVIGGSSTMTERTEGKNRMSCLWSKGTLGK